MHHRCSYSFPGRFQCFLSYSFFGQKRLSNVRKSTSHSFQTPFDPILDLFSKECWRRDCLGTLSRSKAVPCSWKATCRSLACDFCSRASSYAYRPHRRSWASPYIRCVSLVFGRSIWFLVWVPRQFCNLYGRLWSWSNPLLEFRELTPWKRSHRGSKWPSCQRYGWIMSWLVFNWYIEL